MNSRHPQIIAAVIALLIIAMPSFSRTDLGSRPAATAALTASAAPQTAKQAQVKVRIAGRVSDPAGEGVGGAMVKAKSGRKVEAYALTKEDGRYELSAPESLLAGGTVEVSSMGFAPLTLTLSELSKNPEVVLTRQVSQLDEYTVKGKGVKVKRPAWLESAIIYEADLRQATPERNIMGFAKRLPALYELGVNTIVLMPIHPISEKGRRGTLGSPYAVADHKGVNPDYGTLDHLKKFVDLAHHLNMKVLLDVPCGYSGMDHAWVGEHPEYYARTDSGELVVAPGHEDAYKFDYTNPEWRRAMVDVLQYWVKEGGVDGFRFSEADAVPVDFWLRARKTVQHVKPVVFIAEASDPELVKEAFDADYGWPLIDTFAALAATQGTNGYAASRNLPLPEANAQSILEALKSQNGVFPKGAVHLNMTADHDQNAREGTEFDRYGDAARAFAMLTYTLPGVPMLYTGQEAGHERAFNPVEADSVPDYEKNPPMQQFYQILGQLRSAHPVLWAKAGKEARFKVIETTSDSILAFERRRDDDRVLVFVNLSNEVKPLNFPDKAPDVKGMRNQFYHFITSIPTELQPWEFQIFRSRPKVPRKPYPAPIGIISIGGMFNNPGYRRQVLRFFDEVKKTTEYNRKAEEIENE